MNKQNNSIFYIILSALGLSIVTLIWLYPSKEPSEPVSPVVEPIKEQIKPVYEDLDGKG